jgi:hypothetical protein
MNTRSVASSHECSLSTSWYGGGGAAPASVSFTRFGPAVPRCSQTDAAPGAAVEHERDRPLGRGGGGRRDRQPLVRDEEQIGLGLAGVVLQRVGAGRRLILQRRAASGRLMLSDGQLLAAGRFAVLLRLVLLFILFGLVGFGIRRLGLGPSRRC